jgi:UrcA family protein
MLKTLPVLGAVIVASALFVPTASLAAPVIASDDGETAITSVSYADLNLSSSRGISALQYRINDAANSVCGTPFASEVLVSADRRVCVSGAVASAKPAFDEAVRAARHGTVTITNSAALLVSAPRL